MEKLYTVNEAKEYLRISDPTIRRYIKDGRLKTQRMGRQHRITETELKAFFDRQIDYYFGTKNNEGETNND